MTHTDTDTPPPACAMKKREELAAHAHEAWSGWMKYMFDKCKTAAFNSGRTIPSELVFRWKRQMTTPYADLPESEKASDRDEADKILAIIAEAAPNDGV